MTGITEAEFMKKRRREFEGQLNSVANVKAAAIEAAGDSFQDPRVQAEVLFQQRKHVLNRVQALWDGHLLEAEVPQGLHELANEVKEAQQQNDAKRIKKAAQKQQHLAKSIPDFTQRVGEVFLEDEGWMALGLFGDGRCITTDMQKALFFVVGDLSNPPVPIKWTVALQGGFLVSKASFSQGFAFAPAVTTKRRLFISPKFENKRPEETALVRQAAGASHSKWKLLASWEEFAEAVEKTSGPSVPREKQRHFDVIALSSVQESKCLNMRNVFSRDAFIQWCSRVSCCYSLA